MLGWVGRSITRRTFGATAVSTVALARTRLAPRVVASSGGALSQTLRHGTSASALQSPLMALSKHQSALLRYFSSGSIPTTSDGVSTSTPPPTAQSTSAGAETVEAGKEKDQISTGSGGVSGSGLNNKSTPSDEEAKRSLKPKEIVAELDRFIIGQADAKRAVAVALRNRWRRHRLDPSLKDEVMPKNILMVGPTGVGKTEIARRLAKIANAPFIKVEATKFTEVGFHGRDVDQIIKDLVEQAIQLVRAKKRAAAKQAVQKQVEEKLLDALMGQKTVGTGTGTDKSTVKHVDKDRAMWRQHLRDGHLEDQTVEMDVPTPPAGGEREGPWGSATIIGANSSQLSKLLSGLTNPSRAASFLGGVTGGGGDGNGSESGKKKMTIGECRPLLEEAETEKLVSAENDTLIKEAIRSVEQDGIVFIDEIDKIANPGHMRHGPDASAEGVQRDLLPLIEGCSIQTKHGNVQTDHILFIASGAFHSCKPSDLLSELQGRLPIRVELKDLTESDFYRILTEPETNLIKQQTALMKTEGLNLSFDESAIKEIARVAREVNTSIENIGARRLHTVIERIVDEISFEAPDKAGTDVVIGAQLVKTKVSSLTSKGDSRRYIL